MTGFRATAGWTVVGLVLCQTGCLRDLSEHAVYNFSAQQSCPRARTGVAKVEVKVGDLFQLPPAPPEVAADPGRLAVFEKRERELVWQFGQWRLNNKGTIGVVDVAGCGTHTTYFCSGDLTTHPKQEYCDPVNLESEHAEFHGFKIGPEVRVSLLRHLREADHKSEPTWWLWSPYPGRYSSP